jgi:protein SCO1
MVEPPHRGSRSRVPPEHASNPVSAKGRLVGRWTAPALLTLAMTVVLAGAGLALVLKARTHDASSETPGDVAIGGPFHMVDQDGRPADQRVLEGRWSAVFFGYTYCPDTCPATLQALAAAARRLGPRARTFQVVFVSVDPARDTPAQMKLYLQAQGLPVGSVGLTGSAVEVADMARRYRVFYAKNGSGQNYTVDHSAAIYLMNPRGRFVKPLDESQPPDALAGQILSAMQS